MTAGRFRQAGILGSAPASCASELHGREASGFPADAALSGAQAPIRRAEYGIPWRMLRRPQHAPVHATSQDSRQGGLSPLLRSSVQRIGISRAMKRLPPCMAYARGRALASLRLGGRPMEGANSAPGVFLHPDAVVASKRRHAFLRSQLHAGPSS